MLSISFFHSATDVEPLVATGTWNELSDVLAEWRAIDKQRSRKKNHPAMVLAEIKGTRRNENVVAIHGIAADVDTHPEDIRYRSFEEMNDWLTQQGWAFVLYTTTKSSARHHRYRVVLKFEHAIAPAEHLAAWNAVNDKLGGVIDIGTKDPARLSFLPANWVGDYLDDRTGNFVAFADGFNAFESQDGAPILTSEELAALPSRHSVTRKAKPPSSSRRGARARHIEVNPSSGTTASARQHWAVLTDWHRSPYIRDWMREIANEAGQREFRFMCAVARHATRIGLWIDAELLTDIGAAFSTHGLCRHVPDDIARQAKNALEFALAEPSQPEAGPRRSDADISTRK